MNSTNPTADRTRVLVFAPSFPPAYLGGGPARTLSALVAAAPPEFEVLVVTPDRDADGSPLAVPRNKWTAVGAAQVLYANTASWAGTLRMLATMRSTQPDVVYLNSFFNAKYSIVPALLSRFGFWGKPQLLLAPRGEFDQGALRIRRRKKLAFILVVKMIHLYSRVTWHASAAMEKKAIQEVWGQHAQVLIRENETALPAIAAKPSLPSSPGLRAVFLSRIAPKKGLLVALNALRSVSTPIVFNIYGPEEDKTYSSECRRAAELLPDHVKAIFHGAVSPSESQALLSQHDVLILPTAGENFGHVIAEALSGSCLVLCPDTTPWSPVLLRGGGRIVDTNNAGTWTSAIDELQGFSPSKILELRLAAGSAYNEWRSKDQPRHVFDLHRRRNRNRNRVS